MKKHSTSPLPSSFLEWQPSSSATTHCSSPPHDKTTLQNGISYPPKPIRVVPHSEGLWAGHLYFKVTLSSASLSILNELVQKLNSQYPHFNFVLLEPQSELHISVSQTFYLQYHLLEAFTSEIQASLVHIPSFHIHVGQSLEYFTNETCSRDFLSLTITQGSAALKHIVQCVDKVLEKFHFPAFYKPPRFHCSFAWSNPDMPLTSDMIMLIQSQFLALGFAPQSILLDCLLLKIGNRIIQMRLA